MDYEHDPVPNPKSLPPDERAAYAEEAASLLRSMAHDVFSDGLTSAEREDTPKAGCTVRYALSAEGGDLAADGAEKGARIVEGRGVLAPASAFAAPDAEAGGLDDDEPGAFLDFAERTAAWTMPSSAQLRVTVAAELA